jgi:hypothetical protein
MGLWIEDGFVTRKPRGERGERGERIMEERGMKEIIK